MIGKLKGIVDSFGDDFVILDVGGVGYIVFSSSRNLQALEVGNSASMLIETFVREDAITLYGFLETVEKDTFKTLLNIQGVGAKMALAILSALSPHELQDAVFTQDKKAITRANGVGPKLAGRIISELENKLGAVPSSVPKVHSANSKLLDAVSALTNLGFNYNKAYSTIVEFQEDNHGQGHTVEELIKEGLKRLS